MSSKGKINIDPSKLELIRQGKKKVNVTDFNEKKNTFSKKDGHYVAIQKERKFEEAGVTRKKRNFVMYESKQGTERDVDLLKIAGAKKKAPPRPKIEETIISKHKRKEYLDNFQYHETKELKKKKPAVVIHNRVSNPITGTVEETTYQKVLKTSNSAGKNRPGGQRTTTTTTTKTTKTDTRNQSTGNLRGRPQGGVSATKSMESTTKVGRRGGAGGKTSETTTTKKETKTTTTKGGERKTSTRTTTSRGRK